MTYAKAPVCIVSTLIQNRPNRRNLFGRAARKDVPNHSSKSHWLNYLNLFWHAEAPIRPGAHYCASFTDHLQVKFLWIKPTTIMFFFFLSLSLCRPISIRIKIPAAPNRTTLWCVVVLNRGFLCISATLLGVLAILCNIVMLVQIDRSLHERKVWYGNICCPAYVRQTTVGCIFAVLVMADSFNYSFFGSIFSSWV